MTAIQAIGAAAMAAIGVAGLYPLPLAMMRDQITLAQVVAYPKWYIFVGASLVCLGATAWSRAAAWKPTKNEVTKIIQNPLEFRTFSYLSILQIAW